MSYLYIKIRTFYLAIIFLLLTYSCGKTDYTLKISSEKFPEEASEFQFYKTGNNLYKMKLDTLIQGQVHFENDSFAYIVFDNFKDRKIPFFIRNNFIVTSDTIKDTLNNIEFV
ncbi:MAG: hypothetical protein BGO87_13795 [Flavobacteriia bacterium 40-80]|nr:MAG: hypothetical protein BGO87_13795 [Flavobacteriia bacterium 40-80]